MKIAIAGATGFVGSRLVEQLQAQGHEVVIFTRSPQQAGNRFGQAQVIGYNPLRSGEWQAAISGCDAVVNLAGEPIAEKRWTPAQKRTILESRQVGTQKIVEAISLASVKPTVLINASAIGSLRNEGANIQSSIDRLIIQMNGSIAEADAFLKTLN